MALENITSDIERYFQESSNGKPPTFFDLLITVLHHKPLWIIILYRYRRWLMNEFHFPLIKFLLRIFSFLGGTLELLLGINISQKAEIAKGFYIGHHGGIWIGPVVIGEHCNIAHEVTIGIGGRGEFRGFPTIGSRVYIGPGAKIFGQITIGNDVAIGANAVVSKSIPDKAVVVGNPGRVVGYAGSEGMVD